MKMAVAAEAYLAHLQAEGKSPSTCGTAKRTLALLVAHLGAEREAGEVAAEDLRGFFASEAATKQLCLRARVAVRARLAVEE